MSNCQPPAGSDIRAYIAAELDGYVPKLGESGWRRRVLGGRDVATVIAQDVPEKRNICAQMSSREASLLAKYVLKSGRSRADYVRRALRAYLIEHEGMDPSEWPL